MNYIERFRRHYHKVRKVVSKFGGTSISNLKIEIVKFLVEIFCSPQCIHSQVSLCRFL
jgi:hypothetical protein